MTGARNCHDTEVETHGDNERNKGEEGREGGRNEIRKNIKCSDCTY